MVRRHLSPTVNARKKSREPLGVRCRFKRGMQSGWRSATFSPLEPLLLASHPPEGPPPPLKPRPPVAARVPGCRSRPLGSPLPPPASSLKPRPSQKAPVAAPPLRPRPLRFRSPRFPKTRLRPRPLPRPRPVPIRACGSLLIAPESRGPGCRLSAAGGRRCPPCLPPLPAPPSIAVVR